MSLRGVPIRGWKRCVHEAAAFDSQGEYAAATLLDDATAIVWWLRNDPPLLKIPSPIGNFEPDFVYLVKRTGRLSLGVLEIKNDVLWDGEGSSARVKAKAAGEWAKAQTEAAADTVWEVATVLDQDALDAASFEEMRKNALLRFPVE